jgi:ATP-dependent DNA helicase PIF1
VSYEPTADDEILLDETVMEVAAEVPVPCGRLIGCAGSGKTYTLQQRIAADRAYGLLTATTGIASVNLGAGCTTLHSALGYFDTESMRDAYMQGRLVRKLHAIAKNHHTLIIEEYSMLVAEQLDILYRAVQEVNRYKDVTVPLGILLVGDVAQLPPVCPRGADITQLWCFASEYWEQFAANTEKLTKVWRQDGGSFLDALNAMRMGEGLLAADILQHAGARFETQSDNDYDGTTIFDLNEKVDRHNDMVLGRMPGKRITVTARRWGKQRSEWGENKKSHRWGIPPQTDFKIGALVMLLTNSKEPGTEHYNIVNGDCGHIVDYRPASEYLSDYFTVRMIRTGREEQIRKLVRGVEQHDRPDGWAGMKVPRNDDFGEWIPEPHYRGNVRRYVLGQIEYFPMRLAYASTCHKSQGLTLDKVQIDYRGQFFGAEAMMYVALSRCRTLEGLRLVGQKDTFVQRVKMDRRILPWI